MGKQQLPHGHHEASKRAASSFDEAEQPQGILLGAWDAARLLQTLFVYVQQGLIRTAQEHEDGNVRRMATDATAVLVPLVGPHQGQDGANKRHDGATPREQAPLLSAVDDLSASMILHVVQLLLALLHDVGTSSQQAQWPPALQALVAQLHPLVPRATDVNVATVKEIAEQWAPLITLFGFSIVRRLLFVAAAVVLDEAGVVPACYADAVHQLLATMVRVFATYVKSEYVEQVCDAWEDLADAQAEKNPDVSGAMYVYGAWRRAIAIPIGQIPIGQVECEKGAASCWSIHNDCMHVMSPFPLFVV